LVLVAVVDEERGLGHGRAGATIEATHRDDVRLVEDDERQAIDVVNVGEVTDFFVAQIGVPRKESPVDGVLRETTVKRHEFVVVLFSNGAKSKYSA
jgi:hypothetical protein